MAKANAALHARRRADDDPAHGGRAAHRRGQRQRNHQGAIRAWDEQHVEPIDPDVFRREILPGLAGVSLADMVRATGLSQPYCAMIRRGERVPHARHWGVLRGLVT